MTDDTTTHSRYFSPSAAHRWLHCPGSAILNAGVEDIPSAAAEEGTRAHFYASEWLGGWSPKITDLEMAEYVKVYTDFVQRLEAESKTLYVECFVDFGPLVGIDDGSGTGTADALILRPGHAHVVDLKYGRGVQVFAEGNEQMMLYALGVLNDYDYLYDFQSFSLHIVQPRLDHIDTWTVSRAELESFADQVRDTISTVIQAADAIGELDDSGETTWNGLFLSPSEKACRWCKVKATCPALANEVALTVSAGAATDFPHLDDQTMFPAAALDNYATNWLAMAMDLVGLIEDWCRAVRAEVERRLVSGEPVPGWKLVQGRKGARAWTNEQEAEELLRKTFRLKVEDAYDMKLISPTKAEKVLADSPRKWKKAQALITQSEGKPSVAPESDKRPAITVGAVASDFEDIADADYSRTALFGESTDSNGNITENP